ncbi:MULTISPECIES: FadR/GntR family transcriptional regulator [unclassified Maridesulfovibrio]|uniref:FadR/GntR family transcriptional regulator n=1 Tax=unclassified Maridesulfovibrio TaxID=2794999 RepID=UPI003B3F61AC
MKLNQPKLQRKRLSDQIIDELVDRISKGELRPGDRLPPEPQLMERFGVGRSSIREAIGALELLGVLSVRPGQGTRITEATETSKSIGLSLITMGRGKIRELVEARSEIEQTIVGLAAERATEDDIAQIKGEHKKLIHAQQNGHDLIQVDLEFHMAIATSCHNSILIRFFSELHRPMRHWMEQKAKYDWGFANVVAEHKVIINAIESGDPKAAQTAMREHIEIAGKNLISAMLNDIEVEKEA